MGASSLIDTHVLVWLSHEGGRRPRAAVGEALDASNKIVVSAVSALEVSLKVGLGKLEAARPVVADWSRVLAELGADELAVSARHGLVAGSLDWDHRDPFDRLLVAQAQVEGLTLITADRAMLGAPGVDLLAW